MTLTANYGLLLPKNYVFINSTEMEYVDGGWAIENTWWGFNIYLTHKERIAVTAGQVIAGGALGCTGIGAPALAILGTGSSLLWNYDDGYGVRIRMTGPLKVNAILTGIFTLSDSEQKNIASKNKFI